MHTIGIRAERASEIGSFEKGLVTWTLNLDYLLQHFQHWSGKHYLNESRGHYLEGDKIKIGLICEAFPDQPSIGLLGKFIL